MIRIHSHLHFLRAFRSISQLKKSFTHCDIKKPELFTVQQILPQFHHRLVNDALIYQVTNCDTERLSVSEYHDKSRGLVWIKNT